MLSNYRQLTKIGKGRILKVYFLGFILVSLVFLLTFGCSSEQKRLERAKEHYTKGKEAYLLFTPKGLEEAISEYEKAIETNENYALAYAGLGEAYSFWALWNEQNINRKDKSIYDKSIQYSQKAVELGPDLSDSHRALASSYRVLGKFKDAKSEAEKAIELNPSDAEAFYILWTVTGADVDSKYIKKTLELNPNLSIAHNDLGYIYYTKGKYEKATEHLRRAIEINPDLVQAYTNLGLTLAAQKRFDEAEKEYKKAIETNPDYLLAHYNLGVALGSQGEFDEAISEFEEAIEINPDFIESHLTLALAYDSKGETENAMEQYQKFIDLASAKNSSYGKLVAQAKNRVKTLQGGSE
ncbi:MAG: tetratricopeptide repeat protein [Candidatus Dadabacteria bacterium]|nr:tetratricopeptide repeat protein [Candidatus Dadabacteria bacterium]